MNQRRFLFALIVVAVLSTAELFVIFTTITPAKADQQVLWLLFVCLFLCLASVLALLWHPIKALIYRSRNLSRWATLRQATLVSTVITLSLFFRSLSIFSVWDIAPLAISAVLIEFFLQADKSTVFHEPS